MAMTDKERILAFLRSVSPQGATNSEIRGPMHREVRRRASDPPREVSPKTLMGG